MRLALAETLQQTDAHTLAAHSLSLAAIVGAFAGWVPVIVALAPAVYYAILIWESKTVQGWLKRRRVRRIARRVMKKRLKGPR